MRARIEYDEWGREVVVHEESLDHLKGVMEACKTLQSEGATGSREMRHLAEFPGAVIQAYCDRVGITWAEWFQNPVHARVMLNDPDLSGFRVDRGRVALRGE